MKKQQFKLYIRKIVREEVAMAINEVITELKQPSQQSSQPKPKKKIVEKRQFSKNSILNEVLNETADDGEWKTMGGGTYDSSKVDEVMSSQYGDMMNSNTVTVDGKTADFLNKDYRGLLKRAEEKSKQKRGG